VVAEHGPKDVYPSAGEGEHGLAMALALGSLAVIERPRVLVWMLINAEV
jgi:hypothetical protein